MRRWLLRLALACLATVALRGDQRHPMKGVVLSVDRAAKSMAVSTEAVPGFMAAMAMSFAVRDAAALDGVKPGTTIEFVYVLDGKASWAQDIRVRGAVTLDRKQLEIQRLKVLSDIAAPPNRPKPLAIGDRIPDFVLIDQQQQRVALSSLGGKVVALTFGYVRCANPAYCFRLASNLGQVQTQLHDHLGRDLVLLTVVLDPQHDQGQALAEYARVWTSQPAAWHFLTGPLADVQRVAGLFGVEFWKDEGSIVHTLNTVVIDAQGRLAANLEGNEFSAAQLVDLLRATLRRS
jgi:protein SCO1/2